MHTPILVSQLPIHCHSSLRHNWWLPIWCTHAHTFSQIYCFQTDCINLHSHQQCKRDPLNTHTHTHTHTHTNAEVTWSCICYTLTLRWNAYTNIAVCIATNSAKAFPIHSILANICCFRVVRFNHPDRYEVVSHCSFDLYFPDDEWCWAFFSCASWLSGCLLWRSVYSCLLPISSLGYLCFGCSVW